MPIFFVCLVRVGGSYRMSPTLKQRFSIPLPKVILIKKNSGGRKNTMEKINVRIGKDIGL